MKFTRKRLLWCLLGLGVLVGGLYFGRRFQEQFFAISPRGGESLSLPALATVHYRQRDPRWAEEHLGGFGESLAHAGCTVCSLAMALDFYGVKITPKDLNNFLKASDGYNARGWLRWNSVDKLSGGLVKLGYMGHPTFEVIDRALKERQPVLVKVYIKGVIPHWVLVVGKNQQEYLMRDPLSEEGRMGKVSDYGSKIFAVRILKAVRPVHNAGEPPKN